MKTCSKPGCTRRTFMDSERCFDHRRESVGFRVYFALCAILGLVVLGVGIWAVITLVEWVTSR